MAVTTKTGNPDTGFRTMFWFALMPVLLVMMVAYPAWLYFGPPVRGLTRLGPWPERDYIWQKDQAGIPVVPNNPAISDPDVVVIGDSFSMPNAWQSAVSRTTGLRIKTYNYLKNNNCFLPWIDQTVNGLDGHGKLIVVESIERLFMERFVDPERCSDNSVFQISPVEAGVFSWPRELGWTQVDLMRQLRTLRNLWQVYANPVQPVGNWAINAPLKRPDLFSNRKSDRLLYLKLDKLRLQWTQSEIDQAAKVLKKMQDRLEAAGFRFALLIIPDKLHAYEDELLTPLPAHPASDLAKSLRQSGVHAPDVLSPLKQAIYQVTDLYMPNDDHLGPAGQQILGNAVVNSSEIKALLARAK